MALLRTGAAGAGLGVALASSACGLVLGIEDLPAGTSSAGGAGVGGAIADGGAGGGGSPCGAADACECSPGETRCAGNALETCDAGGVWVSEQCATATPVCSHGACVAVVDLSLGIGEAVCAVLGDGRVRCWGRNNQKQAAQPDGEIVSQPAEVAGLGGVSHVASGRYHMCALVAGQPWCWGWNDFGELGVPAGPSSASPVPADVTGVVELALGRNHTCARTEDGAVTCWGDNAFGQLGLGSVGGAMLPPTLPVALGSKAVRLCSGDRHTCAVLEDETLRCWGWNDDAQLGIGTVGGTEPLPVDPGLRGVLAVGCGNLHTCAATPGATFCWGNNDLGACSPDFGDQLVPVVVALPQGADVDQVCAGWRHSCARRTDGTLACWGYDENGQLGDGTPGTSPQPAPVFVQGLGGAAARLACAWNAGCALLEAGPVKCWGTGVFGLLGLGTEDSGVPTTIVW